MTTGSALLALALSVAAPPAVENALTHSLALPGARVQMLDYRPTLPAACAVTRAETARPLGGSGRAALHLFGSGASGSPCEGWAWARVRVLAPVLVTQRPVREGETLEGAVRADLREVQEGRSPLLSLPDKAVAVRSLPAGLALTESDQRSGPAPGEAVAVLVQLGTLTAEQPGRVVSCARGRTCAVLPSGTRVEGTFRQGRLLMEAP